MHSDISTISTPRRTIAKMAITLRQRKAHYQELFKSLERLEPTAQDNIRSCILLTRARQELKTAYHNERRALQALLSFGKNIQKANYEEKCLFKELQSY